MLISCVAYQNGQRLADIAPEDIHRYLVKPDCFVWVALLEPSACARADAGRVRPASARGRGRAPRPPAAEDRGVRRLAVRRAAHDRGGVDGDLRVGEVDVFVGRNYILSVRSGAEKGFKDVRARAENEPDLLRRGPGYVLYALMDAVVDRYFPVLHASKRSSSASRSRSSRTSHRGRTSRRCTR